MPNPLAACIFAEDSTERRLLPNETLQKEHTMIHFLVHDPKDDVGVGDVNIESRMKAQLIALTTQLAQTAMIGAGRALIFRGVWFTWPNASPTISKSR